MTAEEERAAIVSHLRKQSTMCRETVRSCQRKGMMLVAGQAGSDAVTFAIAADAIERGDHLQEKEQ